jgi:hypothetical protein
VYVLAVWASPGRNGKRPCARFFGHGYSCIIPCVRESFRSFDKEVEKRAADWFKTATSQDRWNDDGDFGHTESQPFRVSFEGFSGLAKPGQPRADGILRAAHEKITSDLAYLLQLPVPPVILWNTGPATKRDKWVAISAWAFPAALSWDEAAKHLTGAQITEASVVCSAMLAFETWISAQDRKGAHVLIAVENGLLRLAFIDYAYSLSHSWATGAVSGAVAPYIPITIEKDVVKGVCHRISALGEGDIKGLVLRVPEECLPGDKRSIIITNLQKRQRDIQKLMGVE